MSRILLFSILFILSNLNLKAQKNWAFDIHNEQKSLYEIQENFEDYWHGKTIGKGQGWKPFKRR